MADLIKIINILRFEMNSKSKGELLLMSQNTCGFEILNVAISIICFHKVVLLEKCVVSKPVKKFPYILYIYEFHYFFTAVRHFSLT